MKPIIRLLLCLLVLSLGTVLRAKEPTRREAGKVLVLDNDRTLEGDIERIGDRYQVRRSAGVTWVPAERVVRLCEGKNDALTFLRRRANLDDPDERLRLARWCHLQQMREQALEEVKAAVDLRPHHAESRRLLEYFQEAIRQAARPEKPPLPSQPERNPAGPTVELSAEAMNLFATRIQPILMNACARCHLADSAGAFRLKRTYSVGLGSRKTMQDNLTAVLAQLNLKQPEFSPLLIKAASAHGPLGEAPLKGRQAEAFRTLEGWVRLTLDNNPQLQLTAVPPPTLLKEVASPPSSPPAVQSSSPPTPTRADVPIVPSPTPTEPATPRPVTASPTPATPPPAAPEKPVDEFDPLIFNQQMHPDRKPPSPR